MVRLQRLLRNLRRRSQDEVAHLRQRHGRRQRLPGRRHGNRGLRFQRGLRIVERLRQRRILLVSRNKNNKVLVKVIIKGI